MEKIAMFLDYNLDIENRSVWKIAHPAADAARYPFVVNESGVFYARQHFFTKRYAKNDYQILYTVSGAAQLEYDDAVWRLDEGSLAVIDCNKFHDYRPAPDAGHWTYYWIHVGGEACGQYCKALYPEGFRPHVYGVDSELTACFDEILVQIDSTADAALIRLNHAVSTILTRLMTFLSSAPPSSQKQSVQRAVDYIRSHYAEIRSIDDLADSLNLSRYYFIKLFNRHVGMTPYHYLILCRLNEAKKLLRATDHKLSDIAAAVGFADTSNFSRTFTRMTGVTPGRYRDEG